MCLLGALLRNMHQLDRRTIFWSIGLFLVLTVLVVRLFSAL
jgi:hypothetical protein